MKQIEKDLRRLTTARNIIGGQSYKIAGSALGVSSVRAGEICRNGIRLARIHCVRILKSEYPEDDCTGIEARRNKNEWLKIIDSTIAQLKKNRELHEVRDIFANADDAVKIRKFAESLKI